MVKAIIFDVDGTLLDTERIYMRAWLEAGALFGYMIPDEALRKTRAVNAKTAAACFKEFCGSEFPYETIRKERERIAKEKAEREELEKWREKVERRLINDNDRLRDIEKGDRATQRALLALLDHGIDGNNIKQMQDAKEELQNHLINR